MAEEKTNNAVSKTVAMDAKPFQDGGHAWLVCLASFIGYFLVTMGICTSGILFQEFQKEFGGTNAQTAFIPSVQTSIGALLGVFISPQVRRYGCRATTAFGTLLGTSGYILCSFATNITHMYMSLGLLVGVGNGFLFFSSAVAVQFYFHRRRALASALSTCGVSMAPFVFAPTVQWFISVMSWRAATLQMGAIYLHGFVSAGLMSQPPTDDDYVKKCDDTDDTADSQKNGELCTVHVDSDRFEINYHKHHSEMASTDATSEQSCKIHGSSSGISSANVLQISSRYKYIYTGVTSYLSETFDVSLLRHKAFVLFIGSSSVSLCGHLTTYLYLPVIAVSGINMPPAEAAILISIIGVSTTVGRIISGILGDHELIATHRNIQYGLPMMLTGFSTVLTAFWCKAWILYVYSGIFGLFTGVYFVAQQPLLVQILGVGLFPKSFGILLIFTGSAALLSQPFGGWLVDVTQTPSTPFIVCGSLQVIGGVLAMVTGSPKQQKK